MRERLTGLTAILLGFVVLGTIVLLISAQGPGRGQVLAEVDGEAITAGEVEKALGQQLANLEDQIYKLKQAKIEELVQQKLLEQEAARRGLSVEDLIEAEVTSKADGVTDQEVEEFYQSNKERLRGEEATLRGRIRSYLQERKVEARRAVLLETLRSQSDVVVHLTPPDVYRAEVPVEGAPFRGPEKAPVTIVKFEDFHCPYCRRVQSTLAELQTRYGDKVRIVHRDFPLDSVHPLARKAHEAARCAGLQDKFWAYHDLLYAGEPASTVEQLQSYAQQLELDMDAFTECLSSGTTQAAVEKDVKEGLGLGLNGTPAFFVNGRPIAGALPLQSFVEVIDEELAQNP